jgi:retron-type reverse transcriptase
VPKSDRHLFGNIATFAALHEAAKKAVRGKRAKPGAAGFMANLEKNLIAIEARLQNGTWRGGGYTEMEIFEPKHRLVSAAPFRDRVVHHALCTVVVPIFERGFIVDSYANRTGKGTHRAVTRYEHYRDRYRYVLRCDIFRYFPAIDHAILKRDLRRKISCEQTLALLEQIIDGSNPQEEVNVFFPGDDLLLMAERRRGLPIGNLTSQLFGNVYLNGFDHFVKEVLRAPYLRYVDDFALFADDVALLREWQSRIEKYLQGRRLLLHPEKTFIAPTSEPATFLGYELRAGGYRRLPEASVRRFRNRLRGLRDTWRSGQQDEEIVRQRVNAWVAHASHANTWRLRHALFRGGWFEPLREPESPPGGRAVRGGSWNNTTNNARAANRNNNNPANRNNNNGFRLASTLRTARAETFKDVSGEFRSVQGLS